MHFGKFLELLREIPLADTFRTFRALMGYTRGIRVSISGLFQDLCVACICLEEMTIPMCEARIVCAHDGTHKDIQTLDLAGKFCEQFFLVKTAVN